MGGWVKHTSQIKDNKSQKLSSSRIPGGNQSYSAVSSKPGAE